MPLFDKKHMTIPCQDLKVCRVCGHTKSATEFYSDGRGYPLSECKKCSIIRTGKTAKQPRVRKKDSESAKAKRIRIRDAVFAAYGGAKCACCGETEIKFLTLDHINNDGGVFRRENFGGQGKGGGYQTYYWLYRNGFPEGYQVLCANCNHGKRMNNGICPHQVRCNDYPQGVGSSGPKRATSHLYLVRKEDEEIVCSAHERCSGLFG